MATTSVSPAVTGRAALALMPAGDGSAAQAAPKRRGAPASAIMTA
jgi:hypothetical protein